LIHQFRQNERTSLLAFLALLFVTNAFNQKQFVFSLDLVISCQLNFLFRFFTNPAVAGFKHNVGFAPVTRQCACYSQVESFTLINVNSQRKKNQKRNCNSNNISIKELKTNLKVTYLNSKINKQHLEEIVTNGFFNSFFSFMPGYYTMT